MGSDIFWIGNMRESVFGIYTGRWGVVFVNMQVLYAVMPSHGFFCVGEGRCGVRGCLALSLRNISLHISYCMGGFDVGSLTVTVQMPTWSCSHVMVTVV